MATNTSEMTPVPAGTAPDDVSGRAVKPPQTMSPQQTAGPTQAPSPAPAKMGPLDRAMDPYMQKVLTAVTPDKYKDKILNSYGNNRTLYNLAALALLGVGATAAYRGVRSAFGGGDDGWVYDPSSRRWHKGSGGGGGGFLGGVGNYLLPVALLAGGGYLWNRYGDKITGGIKNIFGGLDDLKEARELWAQNKDKLKEGANSVQEINDFWRKNKDKFQGGVDTLDKVNRAKRKVSNIPVVGPVARKVWRWITK